MASRISKRLSSGKSAPAGRSVEQEKPKPKDGRANNKTPEEHKIKKGEVRNPHGRSGKPKPGLSDRLDELHIAEASRIVSQSPDGPVDALQRVVQQEWYDALVANDEKARIRVTAAAASAFARQAAARKEIMSWFWESKIRYPEMFATAQKLGRPPPDVAHPDHVLIEGDEVLFVGPIDADDRERWETRKAAIKITQFLHAQARKEVAANPSPENQAELKFLEAYRRKLMRTFPTSWNWREDIYCQHSQTKFVKRTIAELQEIFDAET